MMLKDNFINKVRVIASSLRNKGNAFVAAQIKTVQLKLRALEREIKESVKIPHRMVVLMPHLCELHPLEVVHSLPKDKSLRVNIIEELCKVEKRDLEESVNDETIES